MLCVRGPDKDMHHRCGGCRGQRRELGWIPDGQGWLGWKGWEIVEGHLRTVPPHVARPVLMGAFLIYHAAALTDHGDTVTSLLSSLLRNRTYFVSALARSPVSGSDQPLLAHRNRAILIPDGCRGITRISDIYDRACPEFCRAGWFGASETPTGPRASLVFAGIERSCNASSVRDRTPNFRKMCRTWVCTVFSVTNIAAAISRLVRPCVTRVAT